MSGTASENATGIGLMTLAMGLLASADAGIKALAGGYPRPVLLIIMGLGMAVIFEIAARTRGHTIFDRRALSGPALLRSLAEVGASGSMVVALAIVPFTVITMVMQAMPLAVTLGAVVFFGEHVGWRRWVAIGIGLAGVLIILRPGGAEVSTSWLFALGVVVALSLRDLATRAVPREIPTVVITGWGGVAVFLAGVALMLLSGSELPPYRPWDAAIFAMIVVFLAGGLLAVSTAMRMGEVGAVAPFRYTRLPFGIAIGVIIFGETLDSASILGAAIIVASGLYVFFREQAQRRGIQ